MSIPALIVETTFDSEDDAKTIADALIERHLAACIQIFPVQSSFRWEGKSMRSEEWCLRIKTLEAAYPVLEDFIRSNHPYDTPEIIATPIIKGSSGYLNWLKEQVADSL